MNHKASPEVAKNFSPQRQLWAMLKPAGPERCEKKHRSANNFPLLIFHCF
jgi:hypothetical protein